MTTELPEWRRVTLVGGPRDGEVRDVETLDLFHRPPPEILLDVTPQPSLLDATVCDCVVPRLIAVYRQATGRTYRWVGYR